MKDYLTKLLCSTAILLLLTLTAWSDEVIYDTSSTYNTNFFAIANGQQIGNEISLTPSTWSLSGFNVEYYSTNLTFTKNVGVRIQFYANNGTPYNGIGTPGTLFYDSGWDYGLTPDATGDTIDLNNSDLYTNGLLNLNIGSTLPSQFTYTLTFTNLDSANTVELPLANSPTNQAAIGTGNYWVNNNGTWVYLTNSAQANFVVLLTGNSVPEPSMLCLGALGSLAFWAATRRQRKF